MAKTAASSVFARGISFLGSLITVPLALSYLGAERYGVWITISSFTALLAFADLGLGNGLLTAVSRSEGSKDEIKTRSYISSSLVMLLAVVPVLGIGLAVLMAIVDWGSVFNIESGGAARQAQVAVLVFGVLFLVGLPIGITERVQWGLQEGYIAGLWKSAGSILGVLGVVAAIALDAELWGFVLALLGGPLVAASANTIRMFGRTHRGLVPSWAVVSARHVREMLGIGALFLGLQVSVAVAFASDNLVVAQVLGAGFVPQLAVPAQLFGSVTLLAGMVIMPLWPAYGEAIGRGDLAWVRRTFRRSIIGSLALSTVGSLVLLITGRSLLRVWVGESIIPPASLLWALAVWAVLQSVGSAIAMLLNAAGALRVQLALAAAMAPAALIVKILLVPRIGVEGAIWGTVAVYSAVVMLPMVFVVPRVLQKIEDVASGPIEYGLML